MCAPQHLQPLLQIYHVLLPWLIWNSTPEIRVAGFGPVLHRTQVSVISSICQANADFSPTGLTDVLTLLQKRQLRPIVPRKFPMIPVNPPTIIWRPLAWTRTVSLLNLLFLALSGFPHAPSTQAQHLPLTLLISLARLTVCNIAFKISCQIKTRAFTGLRHLS